MKYPICFWNTNTLENCVPNLVETWHDLGITVAMSPSYKRDDKYKMLKILDEAQDFGIKVILCDYRTHWKVLTSNGQDEYRLLAEEAHADYGHHPAVFGFFIGDEPEAHQIDDALCAMRIHQEISPDLTAYLNLLPWFDWIGERMGTDALAPYLDRVKNEGNAKLLSYDCYTQMWEGERGYDDYFNNLREYYLATKRLNTPYWNIVLATGHYYYRCPSKIDMMWQFNTSVAHGASGVSWFYIHQTDLWDNYRNAAINPLGERTQTFYDLSEVNRMFNAYCGYVITKLKIDKCFHVEKAYGGNELFTPFDNVLSVSSENKTPLIFSSFKDEEGRTYYIVCCNSIKNNTLATIKVNDTVRLEKCLMGGRFVPIRPHTDPIGHREGQSAHSVNIWLAPGQLVLLREA